MRAGEAPKSVRPHCTKSGRRSHSALSTRKYSCSAPSVMVAWPSGSPKQAISRRAARSSACIERSSGVFLSSTSPVYEQKTVGMQSVAPLLWRLMKTGLVTSQAV